MNHKGGGDCIGRSHGGATCVRERGGKKREQIKTEEGNSRSKLTRCGSCDRDGTHSVLAANRNVVRKILHGACYQRSRFVTTFPPPTDRHGTV